MAEVARVPANTAVDLLDHSAISSSQVEVAAGNTPVPKVDVGTQSVHTDLPANVAKEIVDESPSMIYNKS